MKIVFEGKFLEVLEDMRRLVQGFDGRMTSPAPEAKVEPELKAEPEAKPKRKRRTKKEIEAEKAEKAEAPEEPPAATPEEPAEAPKAPGVTYDDVKQAFTVIASAEGLGRPVLEEILGKYEAGKISELKPEDLPSVLADANKHLQGVK